MQFNPPTVYAMSLDSSRCMWYQTPQGRHLRCNKNIVITSIGYKIHHHQSCMHEHMTQLQMHMFTQTIITSPSPKLVYMQLTTIHHHITYIQLPTTSTTQATYSCHTNIHHQSSPYMWYQISIRIHKSIDSQKSSLVKFVSQNHNIKLIEHFESKPSKQAQLPMPCILTSHL
jgi:hypothetical protein